MKQGVILIPTYNEEENLEILLLDIFHHIKKLQDWQIELLVIDSYSSDGTPEVVKNLQKDNSNIHLLEVKKEGLGKAYILGFQYALKHFDPFAFVQMDADLSHEPREIPKLLKAIDHGADLVIGSRYIHGSSVPADWALYRKIFSRIGNYIVRFGIFDLAITDWTSGYRAIRSDLIKKLPKSIEQYCGYIFMISTLNFMRMQNAKVKEIPIKFQNRHGGVSKLPVSKYIIDVLKYVIRNSPVVMRLQRHKIN